MNRTLKIVMIVGVVVGLGMTAAMATPAIEKPNIIKGRLGTIYRTDEIWSSPASPVANNPNPADGNPADGGGLQPMSLTYRHGPSALDGGVSVNVGGSALPPGGSAMSSPKQRADRQISRLINRLN